MGWPTKMHVISNNMFLHRRSSTRLYYIIVNKITISVGKLILTFEYNRRLLIKICNVRLQVCIWDIFCKNKNFMTTTNENSTLHNFAFHFEMSSSLCFLLFLNIFLILVDRKVIINTTFQLVHSGRHQVFIFFYWYGITLDYYTVSPRKNKYITEKHKISSLI